jgi:glutamine synthetase
VSQGARLVGLVTPDLCGFLRGRFVAVDDLAAAVDRGVGWVPANIALTPFGFIATPNAFGSTGDLRLRPDLSTRIAVDLPNGTSPLELVLCDQVETDGSDWDCCPRTFARGALERLYDRTGLRLLASFEYEFQLLGERAAPPFSVEAFRQVDPFGPILYDALTQAGCSPEFVIAEYGASQFEVPCAPTVGIEAADRATILLAVVREVARVCGRRATFTPILRPDAVGNGAHVHFSLVEADGRDVSAHDSKTGGLSPETVQFAAGVLLHAPALCAAFAPLPISYLRLRPGRWSSGAPVMRVRDREAFLRICPNDDAGEDHLELRAPDAASSPYLVLGLLALAGLAGIEERLPPPSLSGEGEEASAKPMVESLTKALEALEDDQIVRGWLPPRLLDTYLTVKRAELHAVDGLDDDECCARYANVY